MAEETETTKKRRIPKLRKPTYSRKWMMRLLILLLVVGAVFFAYQYIDTKNELNKAKNPQEAAKQETSDLVKEVGKYLELPSNETPTIATISEKERLNSQPFFKNAQNGDKVLIYTNSEMAILYRPSTKKIIQYAPVSLSGN